MKLVGNSLVASRLQALDEGLGEENASAIIKVAAEEAGVGRAR
ncbi:hypothetical protein [Georgenia daeguensis]